YLPVVYLHFLLFSLHSFSSFTFLFFFHPTPTTEIYTLSLHDALPIYRGRGHGHRRGLRRAEHDVLGGGRALAGDRHPAGPGLRRSEEHTSELQSRGHLVCRLLLEKKKKKIERELGISEFSMR